MSGGRKPLTEEIKMHSREYTRERIQDHVIARLKRQSLLRPSEFEEDIRAVAFEMAACGMINLEGSFFNCFGLRR
jgi:hypothetical protein